MSDSNIRPIMNLGNSIVGVSILAMPYCFSQCGILLGTVLLVSCTLLTQWTCKMLMKAAVMTRNQSYENLALGVFGAVGKYGTGISVIGLNLGTCIAFFVIIGDLAPPIIAQFTGVHWSPTFLRAVILIVAAVLVVFPLALLRSVDSLSGISVASLLFYAILTCQLFFQCWTVAPRGWWNEISLWKNTGLLKCIPIFALAYSCQTQLFIIYSSMHDSSFRRISDVINGATFSVASLYFLVAVFGYISYYSVGVKGDVLANFDLSLFPQLSRFGFSVSVMVSFPLMIFPCRVSINSLFFSSKSNELHVVEPIPQKRFIAITTFIIVSTLAVAILVPNVETVLSLTGATMGTAISFVIPSVIFLKVAGWNSEYSNRAKLCALIGLLVMMLSTTTIIQTEMNNASTADKPGHILSPLDKPADQGIAPVPFEKLPPEKQVDKHDVIPLKLIDKQPKLNHREDDNGFESKKDVVKQPSDIADPDGSERNKMKRGDKIDHQQVDNAVEEGNRKDRRTDIHDRDELQKDGLREDPLHEGQQSKEAVKPIGTAIFQPLDENQAKISVHEQPETQVGQQEHGVMNAPPVLGQPGENKGDNGDIDAVESGTLRPLLQADDSSEVHDKLHKDVSKLHERLNKLEEENKNLKQRQEAIEGGIEVDKLLEGDRDRLNNEHRPGLEVNDNAGANAMQAIIAAGQRTILEAGKDADRQVPSTEELGQRDKHHSEKEVPETPPNHEVHRRDIKEVDSPSLKEHVDQMNSLAENVSTNAAESAPQDQVINGDDKVSSNHSPLAFNLTLHPVSDTSKVSTAEMIKKNSNTVKAGQRDLKTIL